MNDTYYVAGLLFNQARTNVALIQKNRPLWQQGKLNAIGGKIETNEEPLDAMRREFKEETGQHVEDWRLFLTLVGLTWKVHFFTAFGDYTLTTTTDETVFSIKVADITAYNIIPNLSWIIPMALDKDNLYAEVKETI